MLVLAEGLSVGAHALVTTRGVHTGGMGARVGGALVDICVA